MVEQRSKGPSRLWRIVLVVSLALNLAVAGLVVGAGMSGRWAGGPPRSFDFGLGPVVRALERDERRAIGQELRRGAGGDFDMRGQVTDMIAALRADPFDVEPLRDLMAEQSDRMSALQGRARAAFLDQVAAMTPERRAVFADSLQEELTRVRKPREGRSGG